MINPTKASYSMAPTMMVCALAGFLTARLFATGAGRQRLACGRADRSADRSLRQLSACRTSLLAAGYCVFFLVAFLIASSSQTVPAKASAFGMAFLIGLVADAGCARG